MVAYRYQELIAWQMGEAFKLEVFRLVRSSRSAAGDLRYRGQLIGAAQSVTANIIEGFLRHSPGDFRRFLNIGLGSLGEAESRLRDGIQLGYFESADCEPAFRFARRCATACVRLRESQESYMKRGKKARPSPDQIEPDDPNPSTQEDPENPST